MLEISNQVEHSLWSICWFQDRHCGNKLEIVENTSSNLTGMLHVELSYKSPMFQRGPDGKPSFLHRECPQETFPISFRSPSSITVKGPPESPMQDVAPSTIAHCCRDVKFCKTQVFRHSSIVMHCTLSNYEFTIMICIKYAAYYMPDNS